MYRLSKFTLLLILCYSFYFPVSTTKSTLLVVHRRSPHTSIESVDYANDVLRLDQERVDSIHSKLSKTFATRIKPSRSTNLPAKHGSTIGSGNYIVSVGLGTPTRKMSLIFDTGSDLTWIQCEPCTGSCYSQKEPIFNTSSSSSYVNVTCSSPECATLESAGFGSDCVMSNCGYEITYGDKSTTQGILAKERLSLSASDVFDGVTFGCGEDNRGLFHGAAGLLGLGRGEFSFPSQAAKTFNNTFSYCLPSSPRLTGYLTFGSSGISKSVKYTSISFFPHPSFYGIVIEGISVGGKKLEISTDVFSTPGAIIDSGTVISRLPLKAYQTLRTAFKEHMANYTTVTSSGNSILDTCYDFTGLDVDKVNVPKILFYFKGGTVVDLDPGGVLYAHGKSRFCLAFAGNRNEFDTAIFGNAQQKTFQIVHDGPGKRVGFARKGCN